MSTINQHRTIIIGGVAGGASCAARLRRMDEAQITVIERGPHVSFANCGLPYYVGDVITRAGQAPGDNRGCPAAKLSARRARAY